MENMMSIKIYKMKVTYLSSLTLLVLQLILLVMQPAILIFGNSFLVLGILTVLLVLDIWIEDWKKNIATKIMLLSANILCTCTYLNYDVKLSKVLYICSVLLLFLYSLVLKFTKVLTTKIVDSTVIFSSINFYLLAGYTGACLAWFIETIWPGSFVINHPTSSHQLFDFVYFSFVTMATLGNGDVIPSNEVGKTVVLFISLFGQLYLTIFLVITISKYLKQDKS